MLFPLQFLQWLALPYRVVLAGMTPSQRCALPLSKLSPHSQLLLLLLPSQRLSQPKIILCIILVFVHFISLSLTV